MREKCKICDNEFTVLRLGSHIVQTHKMNVQDYFEKYYNFPKSVVEWKSVSFKDVLFAQELLKQYSQFDNYFDLFQHIYDEYNDMRKMDLAFDYNMGKFCICLGVKTNRNLSEKHKAKISKARKGKPLSENHKQKIKDGYYSIPEEKRKEMGRKIAEKNIGHRHSRESILKMIKNRPENNFRGLAGKRSDLGDIYFRSRWEANYARVLNLKQINYYFEPQTFFLKKDDGSEVSYTPDFYLPEKDVYIEVKGYWMDDAKEKFELFKQQYPHLKIDVIDANYYKILENQFKNQIPEWE